MDVVNDKSAILSNYEVFALLQGIAKKGKGKRPAHFHLANIAYDTVKYLEATPCRFQNTQIIQNFLSLLSKKGYKLTKAEKLQLVNLRPTTPVEMQLIIEDSEERLTEEQVEELIMFVQQYLPDESSQVCPNGM